MKRSLLALLVLLIGAAPTALAGSGSHTPWSSIKPEYINPEDWKSWKASMSQEDWDRWQNSITPEQWEAWQNSSTKNSKTAVIEPATPTTYQEASAQTNPWQ